MVAPKREKMACQRSMTQKKEKKKRKRGSHVSKKRDIGMIRERTAIRSESYPSIHPLIHLHLLIEIAWLVSPCILFLTLQYIECKYAMFLSYPELHKSFIEVWKTEGKYCHGEDNKSWVLRESHLGNFSTFLKILQKKISKWIANLWESKYYFVHHSNSQQPKMRRQLSSPM